MVIPAVVIVGSDSLVGGEIRDLISQQAPEVVTRLVGDSADSQILTELAGEPVLINPLDEEVIRGAQAVILAGTAETSRRCMELAESATVAPALIDVTWELERESGAELRAPRVESPRHEAAPARVHIIAHPAATVLAEFFERLHASLPVSRSVVQVFLPASEFGKRGIEELQHQSVNLLSFKSPEHGIFDTQAAFTLLPYYGTEAEISLAVIEERIERHLREVLAWKSAAPAHSLRVVQAPIFHGLSASVWAEFERPAEVRDLIKALASDRIEIRNATEEPPTNAGVTGQSGLVVGRITPDRANPNAAWFWVVADNHGICADNAVCLARLLLPGAEIA